MKLTRTVAAEADGTRIEMSEKFSVERLRKMRAFADTQRALSRFDGLETPGLDGEIARIDAAIAASAPQEPKEQGPTREVPGLGETIGNPDIDDWWADGQPEGWELWSRGSDDAFGVLHLRREVVVIVIGLLNANANRIKFLESKQSADAATIAELRKDRKYTDDEWQEKVAFEVARVSQLQRETQAQKERIAELAEVHDRLKEALGQVEELKAQLSSRGGADARWWFAHENLSEKGQWIFCHNKDHRGCFCANVTESTKDHILRLLNSRPAVNDLKPVYDEDGSTVCWIEKPATKEYEQRIVRGMKGGGVALAARIMLRAIMEFNKFNELDHENNLRLIAREEFGVAAGRECVDLERLASAPSPEPLTVVVEHFIKASEAVLAKCGPEPTLPHAEYFGLKAAIIEGKNALDPCRVDMPEKKEEADAKAQTEAAHRG